MIWCNMHTLHTALERLGFKFSGQVTYFSYLPLANGEITSQFNDWELEHVVIGFVLMVERVFCYW